jgi:hypothetical protein
MLIVSFQFVFMQRRRHMCIVRDVAKSCCPYMCMSLLEYVLNV